ncbi:MAG: RNA-directed DNA polymerase [Cyanobacteria bacterium HKST-UBA02]|nr:RNA-directed DNA polymerase [Cyanobacteria bacterium HKST-UBA02]
MEIVDYNYLANLNFRSSAGRVRSDIRTDLVYAPHFSASFDVIPEEIFEHLRTLVKAHKFYASPPITLESPKRSGLTRPGSILDPLNRLLYQVLVDQIAVDGESQIDRDNVFSQVLLESDPDSEMFVHASDCYSKFLDKIERAAEDSEYVLEADINSFFERIYHHSLVNFLSGVCQDQQAVKSLSQLLFVFTQKDSHGIIQGVFPSDFLGNIYLCPLDADLKILGQRFCRYVDDIYLFFDSRKDAFKRLGYLCQYLRREGLNLNESKTSIKRSEKLVTKDKAVKDLFDEARKEVEAQEILSKDVSYGFAGEWEDSEVLPSMEDDSGWQDFETRAVERLFDYKVENKALSDVIDRFCLPILAASHSDLAVASSIEGIQRRPHMSRDYCRYLASLAKRDDAVAKELGDLLISDDIVYDAQRMWILAAVLQTKYHSEALVDHCIRVLRSREYHQAVRALACIYAGARGAAAQRRIVKQYYQSEESEYVRSAILYTSKYFPKNERDTCITSWGGHSVTNSIVAKTVKELSKRL